MTFVATSSSPLIFPSTVATFAPPQKACVSGGVQPVMRSTLSPTYTAGTHESPVL